MKRTYHGTHRLWSEQDDQVLFDNMRHVKKGRPPGGQPGMWVGVAAQLGRTYPAVRMRVGVLHQRPAAKVDIIPFYQT